MQCRNELQGRERAYTHTHTHTPGGDELQRPAVPAPDPHPAAAGSARGRGPRHAQQAQVLFFFLKSQHTVFTKDITTEYRANILGR